MKKNIYNIIKESIDANDEWLNLGNCGLTEIPPEVFEITSLKELVLSDSYWDKDLRRLVEHSNMGGPNKITKIPNEIKKLTNLRKLVLSGSQSRKRSNHNQLPLFQIENLFPLQFLTNLEELYLGENNISDLSPLANLIKLAVLDLNRNKITSLIPLSNCQMLEDLDLGANSFRNIEGLKSLTNLVRLNLGYNSQLINIDDFPNLEKDSDVILSKTNISDLKPLLGLIRKGIPVNLEKKGKRGLELFECPLLSPPLEIIKQGNKAIINYYDTLENQETVQIFEAKLLIVGEGGAGKTTLARKIINEKSKMPSESDTTKGVDINHWDFAIDSKTNFRVHIWDFGGQEIYHSTHQFFLTKRSLYILVDDTRKDDSKVVDHTFNYWLQVIELLSDSSPVIIVQNEKGDRPKELDMKGMRGRYTNILDKLPTNLLDNRGLDKIKDFIKFHIIKLPHIGEKLPIQWVAIRKYLEKLSGRKDFISLEEYLQICANHGVDDEKAIFLSSYFHDLGVFLHFKDDYSLENLFILNNSWATEAVYKVLDNKQVVSGHGRFNKNQLDSIWNNQIYKHKKRELIALMEKFELCYKLPNANQEWLSPQLLSPEVPDYHWNQEQNLTIKYKYEFLPKGLLSRFMVRMNRYISDTRLAWRNGVVLSRTNSMAEVTETYGKRQVMIRTAGQYKKEFMTLISEEFDKLHDEYIQLDYDKLIPCCCSRCINQPEPDYFSHSDILRRSEIGKTTVECKISYEDVLVNDLLEGVFVRNEFEYSNLTLRDLKANVTNTIKQGRIKESIDLILKSPVSVNYQTDLIVISNRFNEISRTYNLGTIEYQDKNIEISRITKAILEIMQNIIAEQYTPDHVAQAQPAKPTQDDTAGV